MSIAVSPERDSGRDKTIIALVAFAHGASHLMQLAIPPLFPILHGVFGVSFTELGLIATLLFAASGLGQAFAAGPLVDRFGPHRMLIAGTLLSSCAVILAGLVSAYWMLLPLGVLIGLGNSVFHPADLSILSLRVNEKFQGRGFAAHVLGGTLGYAVAPLVVMTVATVSHWRVALVLCGLLGLAIAAALFFNRGLLVCRSAKPAAPAVGKAVPRSGLLGALLSPVFLMAFAYFTLTSFANVGLQTFGIPAFVMGNAFALPAATFAVSAYLFGSAGGAILGGVLADRTQQHHRVAFSGILCAAICMLLITVVGGWAPLVTALMGLMGIAFGMTAPARDVIVRKAAAGAGLGSVFGFVYSGFDLGSAVGPLILGPFMDRQMPQAVFVTVVIALVLAAPTVLRVRRRS
ncbi:MAG: MFS transporter [Deltaproteobacteria bacterium]|nr:MFS transporter [Deltaproteobacteria bacterium]